MTNTTTIIPGYYGKAILKDDQWTVIGGYSDNSEDECVFVVDPDFLPKLHEDDPVYAGISQFDGREKIVDDDMSWVTKEELLSTSQDFLKEGNLPVTQANIEYVALEALNLCDWQCIEGFIMDELDEHIDFDDLPDKK